MNKNLTGIIIILVLLLILAAVCYAVYRKIREKVRRFARMAWGSDSLSQGIRNMETEYASTPKSVSAGTGIYLPQIMKDFPEFHYDEMKERAENVLVSYLRSLDSLNAGLLTEGTWQLKEKLAMQIDMLRGKGRKTHYDKIKVHRTELHRYRKEKGRCSILFQSAVEYVYYTEQDGKAAEGRKDLKTQTKYNTELIYIQDREIVEDTRDMGLGLNCPNCGAPLSGLGARVCAYCDSPVVEWNILVWNFSDIEEIR